MDETTSSSSSSVGLTLGGILSIKQTPPYRIRDRTLLDLIRDDQICGKESKKTWKMFREKLRLKISGSACNTAVPAVVSHAHVSTDGSNRLPTRSVSVSVSVSPPVNNTGSVPSVASHAHVSNDGNRISTVINESSVPVINSHAHVSNDDNSISTVINGSSLPVIDSHTHVSNDGNRISTVINRSSVPAVSSHAHVSNHGRAHVSDDGGEQAVRMSLMSLLEVEASAYMDYGDGDEEEEEVVRVEEGGGGGGGGCYNNCCVCMVRHKGAAFIPCGHTFCRLCSRELFVKRASCPLCNNFILEILDIF